ncbi:hypothetical protein RDWZM_004368 [Blomia tropicalis]|uniref:ACB domain-containing protein n=1 Tax=Blomia tropicalis TaxID=40697 RepID=A0A9Q0MIM9_BLOTA|nr:hypothetical protein RDWZM_004368 [Blomia tropicalis]
MSTIEDQFNAAVKVIRSLPKDGAFQPSNELKLRFYAFFKQATDGPNETKKPPFYDVINRYKWDAWKQCGSMSKAEAMNYYVEELKKVIETLSLNDEVTDFLDMLGPFYVFLPEEIKSKSTSSSPVSTKSASAVHMKSINNLQESMVDDQVTTTTRSITQFNTYDSDGDEFADTFDSSFNKDVDKIPVIMQNGNILSHFTTTTTNEANISNDCEENDTNQSVETIREQVSITQPNNVPINHLANHHQHPHQDQYGLCFNEQLTMAVFRLQHCLDRVMNRIETIESTISQQQLVKK